MEEVDAAPVEEVAGEEAVAKAARAVVRERAPLVGREPHPGVVLGFDARGAGVRRRGAERDEVRELALVGVVRVLGDDERARAQELREADRLRGRAVAAVAVEVDEDLRRSFVFDAPLSSEVDSAHSRVLLSARRSPEVWDRNLRVHLDVNVDAGEGTDVFDVAT